VSEKDDHSAAAFRALLGEYELVAATPEVSEAERVIYCQLVFEKDKHKPQTILAIISEQAAGDFYARLAGGEAVRL
jgi:hypothetical protein